MAEIPELASPSLPEINTGLAQAVGPEALTPMSPNLDIAQKAENLLPEDAIKEVADIKIDNLQGIMRKE